MSGYSQRSRRARRAPFGFTLIELMVALTIGGIAITAIYAIGAASTRVFHQQNQISAAQAAVRNAMNQVKRDLARAGFLSTPGINQPGQSCGNVTAPLHDPGGSGRLAAISSFINDELSNTTSGHHAVDPTGLNAANGFTVDDVVLFGNYDTAFEYPGASLLLGSTTRLAVSSQWFSFRRDFTNWHLASAVIPLAVNVAALNDTFVVGRLIRIRTRSGLYHFAQVTRVTPPTPTDDLIIEFNPGVPTACAASLTGAWVAPVNAIRYYVRDAPAGERETDALDATGEMAQLLREEVEPLGKRLPLLANNAGRRTVVDYIVGFNLAFTSTTQTPPGSADAYTPGLALPQAPDNDPNPPTAGDNDNATAAINDFPERVRAVVIDLAVRTPEQDATFPWANCHRMRCFQVFPGGTGPGARPGAARVRRLRSEVFLANIANEGY